MFKLFFKHTFLHLCSTFQAKHMKMVEKWKNVWKCPKKYFDQLSGAGSTLKLVKILSYGEFGGMCNVCIPMWIVTLFVILLPGLCVYEISLLFHNFPFLSKFHRGFSFLVHLVLLKPLCLEILNLKTLIVFFAHIFISLLH